jgi:hypothetical protein
VDPAGHNKRPAGRGSDHRLYRSSAQRRHTSLLPEDSGANDGDKSATTYHFYDNSQRTIVSGSTPITWNGILLLASWPDPGGYDWINESPATGRNVTVYDGISWGWTLTDPDADVPEPAAWTLMIIGFSALGGALRARRRALA